MDHHFVTFGRILGSKNEPFLSQKRRRKTSQNLRRKKDENGCPKLIGRSDPESARRDAQGQWAVFRHILTYIDSILTRQVR